MIEPSAYSLVALTLARISLPSKAAACSLPPTSTSPTLSTSSPASSLNSVQI